MESGAYPRTDRLTVLFVDDDADTRFAYQLVADCVGIHAELAASGEEAIAKARILLPDVITLDFCMPDLNGLQVLQRLKAEPGTRAIPVVLITAMTGPPAAGARAAASAVLIKPSSMDEIFEAIIRCAAGRGRVAAAKR